MKQDHSHGSRGQQIWNRAPSDHRADAKFRHPKASQQYQQVFHGFPHILSIRHIKQWFTHVFRVTVQVDDSHADDRSEEDTCCPHQLRQHNGYHQIDPRLQQGNSPVFMEDAGRLLESIHGGPHAIQIEAHGQYK